MEGVAAYCATGAEPSLAAVVAAVSAGGQPTLLQLVTELGPALTKPDDVAGRARGTVLLAETLSRLPVLVLDAAALGSLASFLCARLDDFPCLEGVLRGASALAQHHNVGAANARRLLDALAGSLTVQSLSQSMRSCAFELILALLTLFGAELAAADGTEALLQGVVGAVDGEKDPRNLVLTFGIVAQLARTFPLKHGPVAEELFDVAACYFPVTFEAPQGDPHGISGERLREELRAALGSTPIFCAQSVPLVIEKLSGPPGTGPKVDCLRTLASFCKSYGATSMRPYFEQIWAKLVEESGAADEDVADAAGVTIGALLRLFAPDDPKCVAAVEGARELLESTLTYSVSDKASVQRSTRLLTAMCDSSVATCSSIVDVCMGTVLSQFTQREAADPAREAIAFVLLRLTRTVSKYQFETHPLAARMAEIVAAVSECCQLGESEIALPTLHAMGIHLISIIIPMSEESGMLGSDAIADQLALVLGTILLVPSNSLVSEACTAALDMLRDSAEMQQQMVEPVLAEIHTASSADDALSVAKVTGLLHAVSALAAHEQWFCAMLPGVVADVGTCPAAMVPALLSFLSILPSVEFTAPVEKCAMDALRQLVGAGVSSGLTDVIMSVTCRCGTAAQNELLAFLAERTYLASGGPVMSPGTLYAAAAAVVSCRRDALLPELAQASAYAASVVDWGSVSMRECTAAGQWIGSCVNKSEPLPQEVSAAVTSLTQAATDHGDRERQLRALECVTWVAKGAVYRDHELGRLLLALFCEELLSDDQRVADACGEALGTILGGEPNDVYSRANHFNVRLLYRQKLLVTTLPVLCEQIGAAGKGDNARLVIATMVSRVPFKLLPAVELVLPAMITSLGSANAALSAKSAAFFARLVADEPSVAAAHLDSIVPRCVRLTRPECAEQAKLQALRCLIGLSKLPHSQIYPHVKTVVQGLEGATDDPKRAVRRTATTARNVWELLTNN